MGSVTQNNAARVVDVQALTGGSVTFGGTVTGGASSQGVHIGDTTTANGSVSFTTLNLGTAGARMTSQAVTIGNAGGNSTGTYSLGTVGIFTSGASGAGIVATNADGTINSTTGIVDASGATAINISGPVGLTTLGMTLSDVTSTGGTNNVSLSNVGGSLTMSGGALSGATSTAVAIGTATASSGGTASVSYAGTITKTSGTGETVNVRNKTGGTVTFSGALCSTVTPCTGGVSLTTNPSATIIFQGGVSLSTGTSAAFTATGGGTVNVCDENPCGTGSAVVNTLTTTTGTALNVANTTIGGSGLTFRSISAGTAASGPANGIVLNNTGSSGGLTVSGNGGTCSTVANCTGGAIQNATGSGVSLNNVLGGVSLTRMIIIDSGADGVTGTTVAGGFNLDNATITSNGTNLAAPGGGVHGDHGIDFTDLTGTSTFTNSNVSNNRDSNVVVTNASGILNLNVNGGTYSGAGGGMGDGIFVSGTGTGSQNLNVQGPITFANNVGDHIQHGMEPTSTADSVVIINNTTMTSPPAPGGGPLCANNILGGGITVVAGGPTSGGGSHTTATITNNNIQNSCIGAIVVGTTGSVGNQQIANVNATITGNTIGTAGVAGSGSVQGNGIFVDSNGNSVVRVLIENNTIRQWTNRNGIALDVIDGDAEMSATIRNNIITEPNSAFTGTSTRGMTIQLGSGQAGDSVDVCLDIGHPTNNALKNQVFGTGEGIQPDVRYLHEGPGSSVQLVGYTGPAAPTITDIANWFQPRNNLGGTPTVTGTATAPGGSTTTGAASCVQP
jgi:hypothetical protein